tara:strand:- start:14 stop:385 length:372 start_codon:yes stop_codon:yes gene_type:complete
MSTKQNDIYLENLIDIYDEEQVEESLKVNGLDGLAEFMKSKETGDYYSNCCGAGAELEMCTECYEHCAAIPVVDPEEYCDCTDSSYNCRGSIVTMKCDYCGNRPKSLSKRLQIKREFLNKQSV